jgi:Fe-S cluster biogenesis protein NfuA
MCYAFRSEAKVSEVASKSPASAASTGNAGGSTTGPVAGLVKKALSEFAIALVHADGGELYLVNATNDDVHLHLTGTCAGCPGATITRERLLEPAVHGAAPKAVLKVTTGYNVPTGALRVE